MPLNEWMVAVVVQHMSHDWLFVTPWTAAHQASLSFTISQSLLRFMFTESVMLSNHLILCWPLLSPSILPSIRIFYNESALHIRWPKYWSFSFSISHSNEYSGLTSFRIALIDLLAVQGTLKSLLQHHHNLKALILWCSAFFMAQLSHLYMTIRIFVSKVMFLLFNMLSRFVIPGGGHDNPLQYYCLENPMEREAWQATVCGVTQSQTRLKRLSTHARSVCYSFPSKKEASFNLMAAINICII